VSPHPIGFHFSNSHHDSQFTDTIASATSIAVSIENDELGAARTKSPDLSPIHAVLVAIAAVALVLVITVLAQVFFMRWKKNRAIHVSRLLSEIRNQKATEPLPEVQRFRRSISASLPILVDT
jgi:hypothetical protein